MHSFLKVTYGEGIENPVVMTLVRQIREQAYHEDCLEFVEHLNKKKNPFISENSTRSPV
ncbi:hypothetical protein TRIUR3_05846 [Triticum urartu]|uniref:Uncharacterized protein n=1 Tax=Triticum urartu TaxID=4572 RepID=M7YDH9_TRIUA|nr:hypothetical protein TRIUR3_05846 [Triticum urartu]